MSALSDLYALIPSEGYILGRDLPSVFAQYEAKRGAELLLPSERDKLEVFGRENGGVRVDAGLLVGLMGQFLGAGEGEGKVESGRVGGKGRQLTLADADMSLLNDTQPPFTPTATDDHDDAPTGETPSSHRAQSTGKPMTPGTSHIPRRRLPDTKSPAAPPPSSYTPFSNTHVRRGSDPAASSASPSQPVIGRSSSALSNHSYTSSTGSKIARPKPPRTSTSRRSTSPAAAVFDRPASRRDTARRTSSNHPADPFGEGAGGGVPGSPELPALKGVHPELSMLDETSFVGRGMGVEVGDVTGDVTGDELEEGMRRGSRLDRISTASTGSLASTHDALQALKRENTELVKKKNELARQLQVIGAETEAQMADLQESLDGARAELAMKRKEEKESRTREAQLGTQICTLELEMQHLQQQLSTARESHATQQRMLQDANGEADRLREVLLSREEDVAGLKGAIEGYEDEKRSWQDQLETLQATNATLQTSLQAAQEAARTLERRKAENQELQQTIKRLTHELDILRTQQTTGARHGREATDASAAGDSVASRAGTGQRMSLGDELRSVFDAEDSDGEKGEKGKTVVRTVTYRTERVIHHRKKESPDDNDSEPETSFVEEIVREYTDAGVATDPEVPAIPVMSSSSIQTDETHQGTLPPYSPRSDAEIASEALAHAHPALEVTEKVDLQRHGELALKYAEMTMGAGLRCTVLEGKLQVKQDQAMRVQGGIVSSGRVSVAPTSGLSLRSLLYLFAALLAVGVAGYYLGSRQSTLRQLDNLRIVLRHYTLPFLNLFVKEFAPRTMAIQAFAGGFKQLAGRIPI